MIKSFRDLEAWKKGHELVLKVYKLTENFPSSEKFGIVSQLQRALVSITSNLAEGFSRYYFKDRVRFYYQSRGSASEVENLLIISRDIGYLNPQIVKNLLKELEEIQLIINGLIKKTNEIHESRENL